MKCRERFTFAGMSSRATIAFMSTFVTLLVLTTAGQASTGKVLYNFANDPDGANDWGGVISNAKGTLYGATLQGGTSGFGTVFELKRTNGSWMESVLYSFAGGSSDGAYSYAGVSFDKKGNLYGATYEGGAYGYGTVFELKHTNGGWTESVLYNFTGGSDGSLPEAGVILDARGNLYGTTYQGGAGGYGVVFELKQSKGGWTESVLYSFTGGSDGANPMADVVFGKAGNLYGSTYKGGTSGYGVVFELEHSKGGWTESVLYSFTGGSDGGQPAFGSLIFDKAGDLFGTTEVGGASGNGTVFELKYSKATWVESVLYSFTGAGDGSLPIGGLIFDAKGNLYGTTEAGGNAYGVVFELKHSNGMWTETVLYAFSGSDGASPVNVVLHNGNLYGGTIAGGTYDYGVVYEITP
jgi:uncharacterized repeat protein (TIGR03803 family)